MTLDSSGRCHHHATSTISIGGPIPDRTVAPDATLQDQDEWYPEWEEDDWSIEAASKWVSAGFSMRDANSWYWMLTGQPTGGSEREWTIPMDEAIQYASTWRALTERAEAPSGWWEMRVGRVRDATYGHTDMMSTMPEHWDIRLSHRDQWNDQMEWFNQLFPSTEHEVRFFERTRTSVPTAKITMEQSRILLAAHEDDSIFGDTMDSDRIADVIVEARSRGLTAKDLTSIFYANGTNPSRALAYMDEGDSVEKVRGLSLVEDGKVETYRAAYDKAANSGTPNGEIAAVAAEEVNEP